MIQLTSSVPLVEGTRYWAQRLDRRIAIWEARTPPGKDFIALYPIGREEVYMTLDYFHWWTTDIRNFPYLGQCYLIEQEKIAAELTRRRESRRKR